MRMPRSAIRCATGAPAQAAGRSSSEIAASIRMGAGRILPVVLGRLRTAPKSTTYRFPGYAVTTSYGLARPYLQSSEHPSVGDADGDLCGPALPHVRRERRHQLGLAIEARQVDDGLPRVGAEEHA